MSTSHPVSSSSEVAPPGLPAPVNNSANVASLAAILRDVLSPGGSSESALSPGPLVMWFVKNFLCSLHVIFLAFVHGRGFWRRSAFGVSFSRTSHEQRDVVDCSIATRNRCRRDLALDTIGDLLCGGIVCHGCVFNPLLSVSLFSTARSEKDGYFKERCPEDDGVLRGPKGNVKLERSGGLDYLVSGQEQCVFSCFAHTLLGRWRSLSHR